MRWAVHVVCIGERRGAYRVLVGETWGKETIWRGQDSTKMVLKKVGWRAWTGCIWLRTGTGGGLLWMR
jgi:hypothetical protein